MKAIILSAGQGSRLLPLTNDTPKCLVPVGSKSVLQWQIETLARYDEISEIFVVTGFMSEKVAAAIEEFQTQGTPVTSVFNPFYNVADNLASCWIARDCMDGDFLILNGDSLFETPVLRQVLDQASAPINLTINHKGAFDADDMKVSLTGDRVDAVGKTICAQETHAESIGLVLFKGEGAKLFRNQIDAMMRDGSGITAWYLQVIDQLAKAGHVGATDIGALEWCEIDYPSDLDEARKLVAGWDRLRIVA